MMKSVARVYELKLAAVSHAKPYILRVSGNTGKCYACGGQNILMKMELAHNMAICWCCKDLPAPTTFTPYHPSCVNAARVDSRAEFALFTVARIVDINLKSFMQNVRECCDACGAYSSNMKNPYNTDSVHGYLCVGCVTDIQIRGRAMLTRLFLTKQAIIIINVSGDINTYLTRIATHVIAYS